MADYFTHFSCLLDVITPDKAARALALFQSLREADQDAEDPEVAGFDLVRQDAPEDSTLWIHDDEHGDVEAVIRFVLRLVAELDLTGLWGFEYALCRIRHKAYYPGCRIMPRGLRPPANINFPSDPDSQVLQAVVQLTFNPNPSVSP